MAKTVIKDDEAWIREVHREHLNVNLWIILDEVFHDGAEAFRLVEIVDLVWCKPVVYSKSS
ncbi:hypothetical protein [Paenibacillus planticolens]|uniref:Uncharacterized protein n=1 Tax=Paenibacillus planticolens TaxID=2654976 RepID=A0ABX1ZFP8_9BACL|nr:hypothetical protein [Paenibacillus planticolens]NOU98906.1 hypothetical protein [Paenibacillus planticolens]